MFDSPTTLTIKGRPRHPADGWTLADPRPASRATRGALRGVIRALCAPAPASEVPNFEERVEVHVRRMLQYMPGPVALGFIFAVHIVD